METLTTKALTSYFQFAKSLADVGIKKPRMSWDDDSFALEWHKGKDHHLVIECGDVYKSDMSVHFMALLPEKRIVEICCLQWACEKFQELFDAGELDWMKDDSCGGVSDGI
jgi:hypothetical protein